MSIVRKYFFIVFCLILSGNAWGQAARSPFTTIGIGEPYGSALINTQGMAGVGVSQPQFWYLNNQNPALLIYNNLTVFQAGILMERRSIKGDTISEKSTGGNMNYLVTAFPIKPGRWTTSLGLMPYTTVKYKFSYIDDIENSTEKVSVIEEGSGGLTQLYWSNGIRLSKDFAVGLKTTYIFSSIVNSYKNTLAPRPNQTQYVAAIEEKSYVKDLSFSAGVSYSKDSLFNQKKYRLSIGAVYNFAADLNTTKTDKLVRTTMSGDTVESVILPSSQRGSIDIPAGFTAGISLSRDNRWVLGTEFSFQDWTTFESVDRDDEGLGKSWRIAVGGETTPNGFDESYFKRVTYRLGASIEQTPFLANNNPVKDIGINFGFSLPAGRSSLDLAFKYGKRGNRTDNILAEDYFKIYFGLTFNDQWFIKRRFD
jgi:hypothetical protein